MSDINLQDLMSLDDVAQCLNIPKNTIRLWVFERKLPSHKLGRHTRIRRSDLLAFIASRRRELKSRLGLVAKKSADS